MKIITLVLLGCMCAFAQQGIFTNPSTGGGGGGGGGTCSAAGAAGAIQASDGAGNCVDSGSTSTAGAIGASSIQVSGAYSGSWLFGSLTNGHVAGFAIADVGSTTDLMYILPTTNPTAGQYLLDSGAVTCPTLPGGSPALCHQLSAASIPFKYPADFRNGTAVLVPGASVVKYQTIDSACTATEWSIYVDSGTISVDIWRLASTTTLPVVGNTLITGTSYPTNVNQHLRSTSFAGFLSGTAPVFAAHDELAIVLQAVTGSPTNAKFELVCQ